MADNNFWIKPVNKRIKETFNDESGSLIRAIRCVMPVAVYYYMCMFITFGAAYLIGTGQYGTEVSEVFANNSDMIAFIIRIFVLIIAVAPLVYPFILEKPVILQNSETGGKDKGQYFAFAMLFAASLALFLNIVFVKTGFTSISASYEATSSRQFSLSLWTGMILYGIFTPVAEEIVYRGLVYNRLRRYFDMPLPVIIGPLLFGVAHGNVVQLLYAFIMGFAICFVYERYGSFVYPVLFHITANSIVYLVFKIETLRNMLFSSSATIITGVISAVVFWAISHDEETKENVH